MSLSNIGRKEYVYIILAIIISAVFITGYSIYDEFNNDFYYSDTYQAIDGKETNDAIAILKNARKTGRQKNTFQIYVSYHLGMKFLESNEIIEAEKYLNEVVSTKPKLIGNIFYNLNSYNNLKREACLSLARIHLDKEENEKAKYLIDLAQKDLPYFGCGTGAMRFYNEVARLNLDYALSTNDIKLAIYELQYSLFQLEADSKDLTWLISLIKSKYSVGEIQKELNNLITTINEIDLREDEEDLPYFEYSSKFFGVDIILANESFFFSNEKDNIEEYCDFRDMSSLSSICRLNYLKHFLKNSLIYTKLNET